MTQEDRAFVEGLLHAFERKMLDRFKSLEQRLDTLHIRLDLVDASLADVLCRQDELGERLRKLEESK